MYDVFYALLTLPLTIFSIMPKKKKVTRRKPDLTKEIIDRYLLGIATEMELLKANNRGKLPYDALTKAVNEMKGILPWLTVVKFKYYLNKINKNAVPRPDVASAPNPKSLQHNESQTSAISDFSMDGINVKLSNKFESFSYIDEDSLSGVVLEKYEENSSTMDDLTTAPSTIVTSSTTSFGGRPKGTTTALSTAMANLTKQCIANSGQEFMSVREEERKKCKRSGKKH